MAALGTSWSTTSESVFQDVRPPTSSLSRPRLAHSRRASGASPEMLLRDPRQRVPGMRDPHSSLTPQIQRERKLGIAFLRWHNHPTRGMAGILKAGETAAFCLLGIDGELLIDRSEERRVGKERIAR